MAEIPQTAPWIMITLISGVVVMAITSLVLVVAALYLRWRAVLEETTRHQWFTHWRPHLYEVLEGRRPTDSLTDLVPPKRRRLFLDFLLEYMRVVKGFDEYRLTLLGRDFVDLMLPEFRSADETRRALAIEIIGTFGIADHLEVLDEALRDRSNLVAMIAAHTLVAHGGPLEIAGVLDVLDRFSFWDRRHLASFLHRTGPDISAALVVIMTDDVRPIGARLAAIETLEHMADARAADAAAMLLATDESVEVQSACLRLLGVVGRPVHEPVVRGLFRSENEILRMHAVTAWSRMAGVGHFLPLVEAMSDESTWVAIRAAHALHEMREIETLQELADSVHPRADLARSMLVDAR